VFVTLLMIFLQTALQGQITRLVAVNDTADIWPGTPVTLNLLINDTVHDVDSLRLVVIGDGGAWSHLKFTVNPDYSVTFLLDRWGYSGIITKNYLLWKFPTDTISNEAEIVLNIHDNSSGYLDLNNIRARINPAGNHFNFDSAQFEAPKGSGKTSVFANALWIGGLDSERKIHLAAEQYQMGFSHDHWTMHDFWAGPVSDSAAYTKDFDYTWNYLWKIDRDEIEYHRNHFWERGYVPIKNILTWPAHGDTTLGQAFGLAPFVDRNGNGLYEPFDGDYPQIRGDQALFFIFNDDRNKHTETHGKKMKVEIHGMAYAFNQPNDTAFSNTIFFHYRIINRSAIVYSDTYLGVFTDIDIGYPKDDYYGCDVERGMYYGYNGKAVDGAGQSYAYGENPPAQGVVILAGPRLDADGYDNPSYRGSSLRGPSFAGSCDVVGLSGQLQTIQFGPDNSITGSFLVRSEAVNGANFGDGIVDNERYGLCSLMLCESGNPGYGYLYPYDCEHYYQSLQGLWFDSTHMLYGGNGYNRFSGYGPACRFMFPGTTDRCYFSTAGLPPNGPREWTERSVGSKPQDRRGSGSSGPFTFKPGEPQELDLAFVWARGDNPSDSSSSLLKLMSVVDTIRRCFFENRVPGGGAFFGSEDGTVITGELKVYPNPSDGIIHVDIPGNTNDEVVITLFNLQGIPVLTVHAFPSVSGKIDLTGFSAGMYLLRVSSPENTWIGKIILQ
jgi:hypothetical protein